MKLLVLLVAVFIIACTALPARSPNRNCPEVCPTVYMPVCGSDGNVYPNECTLAVRRCMSGDFTLTTVPCSENRQAEECPEACSKVYDPVCGSDDQTYGNDCEFRKAQCQDPSLTLKLKPREKRQAEECPEVCLQVHDPVCGSDDKTYGNDCEFRKAQCQDPSLTLKSRGECGSNEKRQAEECPEVCLQVHDPVCGSDDKTYGNDCEFRKAQCQDPSLTLKSRGECGSTEKRQAEECPEVCLQVHDPVCGSDDKTYGNDCEFLKAQCQDPSLTLQSRGECERIEKRRAEECPEACFKVYDPVCGSDDQTYGNDCEFRKAQCQDPSLTLKSRGECGRIEKRQAEECPEVCLQVHDPVCGSDDKTYGNDCEFLKAQCQDPSLTLQSRGECERIEKGQTEECPEVCLQVYDPVCGSDDQTYGNDCKFLQAQCQDPSLTLRSRGECGRIEKRRAEECPAFCIQVYNPVCGSDDNTYGNRCEFLKAKCQDPSLTLKGRGECGRIDFSCDGFCFELYDPQCGSDGHTYKNKCYFLKQQICQDPTLTISSNC